MDIIFGRKNAEKLREKYTVLDLEVVIKDGHEFEVFCLIPAEKIAITDLPNLEEWVKMHNDFLVGYSNKHYEYCRQCIDYLMGKFGGEVDTFYEEILHRINEAEPINSSD
jgi:hypothetical protein